jgi:hypothetical protein
MRYTHELRAGSAREWFYYRPSIEASLPESPQNATVTVIGPTGKPLTQAIELAWDSDSGRLWADLDTTGWASARHHRAEIRFDNGTRSYLRQIYVDVLPDPWRPNLTAQDLSALAPLAALDLGESGADYAALIGEAEEQIRLQLLARGVSPGLLRNRAALDRCHRLLALSLVYLRAADGRDAGMWTKHTNWREQYDRALSELLSVSELDANLDLARDEAPHDRSAVRLTP